ncbi:MAG: ATP-binding protein [Lachnospiraceae bacterium]|nr:ATP-binding protein [Lachnospiraceae bacterium]
MALRTEQYNALMREYSLRAARNRRELEERTERIGLLVPRLPEVKRALAVNSAARARAGILGNEEALPALEEEHKALREELAGIMNSGLFDPKDLELQYTCPDCRDTGFIGNVPCHCFQQAAIDLLYEQSSVKSRLADENFGTLSMEYYDRQAPEGKRSQYEVMKDRVAFLRKYAAEFGENSGSLLFYGPTGTGKTFFSNCIARELIESCHSVVYFSAIDLFDLFSKNSFSYNEEDGEELFRFITESDLLIIDDLGTEHVTAFTVSKLFYCVNERLNAGKSMIISTNLSPGALRDLYTERVASRILAGFEPVAFSGKDIRVMKKYGSSVQ